jgi:hypothetical protein
MANLSFILRATTARSLLFRARTNRLGRQGLPLELDLDLRRLRWARQYGTGLVLHAIGWRQMGASAWTQRSVCGGGLSGKSGSLVAHAGYLMPRSLIAGALSH